MAILEFIKNHLPETFKEMEGNLDKWIKTARCILSLTSGLNEYDN